jgi:hypothetical protein
VTTPDGKVVEQEILYPANPGSIYHMTKTQDALFFSYYNKNDGMRVTDLHQGLVWGTHTPETMRDERLINRFDYDGDYGTVLNRFLMQAAVGYPLTVHGTGGQTRAFIHIRDTVKCIELALANPPKRGEKVKIFDRNAPRARTGRHDRWSHRSESFLSAQPTQGSGRERTARREQVLHRPRPEADDFAGRPDARGHRDRQEVRCPL